MDYFLMAEEDWKFLLEVALRSVISFGVVLVALRLTGKRGVKQLTLFELVIILTLGSAAGDICFYKEVALLPVLISIATIIILYRIVTYWVRKSDALEHFIEGKAVKIIENGRFTEEVSSNENISFDEFFMEMRLKGVEHLGQVRFAFLEVNGDVSVFKFEREEVKPGLHIFPHIVSEKFTTKNETGLYSCIHCGYTEKMSLDKEKSCPHCRNNIWARGSDRV